MDCNFYIFRIVMTSFILGVTACNSSSTADGPADVIARVNGVPITVPQIDPAISPRKSDGPTGSNAAQAPSSIALQTLIERQLIVQKAREEGLDREPEVMLATESAKRAVLANEWIRRSVEDVAPPSEKDIEGYFNQHPELFSNRHIYSFRLVTLQAAASQLPRIQEQLTRSKGLDQVLDYMRLSGTHFVINDLNRDSEQMPPDLLQQFDKLKEGELAAFLYGGSIDVVELLSARPLPLDEAEARPLITKRLKELRTNERAETAIQALKATARIELVVDLKQPAAAPPNTTPASNGVVEGIATGLR